MLFLVFIAHGEQRKFNSEAGKYFVYRPSGNCSDGKDVCWHALSEKNLILKWSFSLLTQVCPNILQHSIATISKQKFLLPRRVSIGLTRMLVPIATLSKPIATNRRTEEVGLWSGVIPSQLIQASRLARTLSLHGLHGQPAMLTHECPSTTVPLSETHYEAMNFALWRTIGKEFLIKSNINNWIACKEGSGSLVMQKVGFLSCKLVKQILVSEQCAGVVPNYIRMYRPGPGLFSDNAYYYFDGSTSRNWPTHDPCGRNDENQVKGVVNPHGNIFVKWKISQAPAENWRGTKIKSLNANKLSKGQ